MDRRLPLAVGLDVFVVVLFVAIGRRNHDEEPGIVGVLETATPFLLGLLVGWMVARAWRRPGALAVGMIVWPVTVVAGMLVRNLAFDDGTAASFVVVATLFLGVTLLGWRAVAALVDGRRSARLADQAASGGSLTAR